LILNAEPYNFFLDRCCSCS